MIDARAAQDDRQRLPRRRSARERQLFKLDVDVLVPAALENQITMENAPTINAKVIAEGANGLTTTPRPTSTYERGVFVIPDILANAGGVTTRTSSGCRTIHGYFWTEEEVNSRLEADVRGVRRRLADVDQIQDRFANRCLHRRD